MNRFCVLASLALACFVGCESQQPQPAPLAAQSTNVVQAAAINGNVPTIAYDNVRAYTMVVLPDGGANDPFCKQVVDAFAGDATIRSSSIVRLHNADKNFCERWGNSFAEARQGTPTVAVLQEVGDQVRSVYKMPIDRNTDIAAEVARVKRSLVEINVNKPCPDCPSCPKPAPDNRPLQPNQPTMPALVNTPNATPAEQADDNKMGLILVAVVAALAGGAAYYSRG